MHMHYYRGMCSLVMNPFSRNFLYTQLDQLRYLKQLFINLILKILHGAWFLDGRTSIPVVVGTNAI